MFVGGLLVPRESLKPEGAPPPLTQFKFAEGLTKVAPLAGETKIAGLGGLVTIRGAIMNCILERLVETVPVAEVEASVLSL